jgi:hypothetical protein
MRPGPARGLSAAQQFFNLQHGPSVPGHGTLRAGALAWKCDLSPTPLSRDYKVRIEYRYGGSPNVFVDSPDLVQLAEGRKLPHVYQQSPTRLCLYLPNSGEWHDRMLISESCLPWTMLWLFYFEEWLLSGEWKGGGQHPPPQDRRKSARRNSGATGRGRRP